MNSRVKIAEEKHKKGYNCAQAIACTYCDLFGMDEENAFRATEGFGGGMGAMEGTCGAVSGAVFLEGLKESTGNLLSPDSKGKTYRLSKAITRKFKDQNGSLVCKELKGLVADKEVFRTCPGCIEDAAKLVEGILLSEEEKEEGR